MHPFRIQHLSMKTARPGRQAGVTLVIALLFLVVLTMLVLSAINSGTLGLRIAMNMQLQKEAATTAQAYLDAKLASLTFFQSPPTTVTTDTTTFPNYTMTLAAPLCLGISTAEASGSRSQVAPIAITNPTPEYLWDLSVIARDNLTGASAEVHQGVKVRMAVGTQCPN